MGTVTILRPILMHSSKLELLLMVTGVFIPLVSVPFSEGYRRNAGLIENIQSMSLPLTRDRYTPNFQAFLTDAEVFGSASKSDHKKDSATKTKRDIFDTVAQQANSPSPSTTSSLPSHDESVSARRPWERDPIVASPTGYEPVTYGDSGKKVFFHNSTTDEEIKNILRAARQEIEGATSKNLMFSGWSLSQHGLRLPFSFVVSGSVAIAFSGVVLLIFTRRWT
jgi:hypothetical protein